MTIEDGTAIVLAYVLVSMGVIIAFLLAAFVIGWFIGRLLERTPSCASASPRKRPLRIKCDPSLSTLADFRRLSRTSVVYFARSKVTMLRVIPLSAQFGITR